MWPEQISFKGLDFLGRSVESTYINYVDNSKPDDPIDLEFFEKMVLTAPDSYLAWDMRGWGLYKNKSYKKFIVCLQIVVWLPALCEGSKTKLNSLYTKFLPVDCAILFIQDVDHITHFS